MNYNLSPEAVAKLLQQYDYQLENWSPLSISCPKTGDTATGTFAWDVIHLLEAEDLTEEE